jgi:hypothetical protein
MGFTMAVTMDVRPPPLGFSKIYSLRILLFFFGGKGFCVENVEKIDFI